MSFVGSIDQGTTSSRFLIFDQRREVVASAQMEHKQITTAPGHLEHDPAEIYANVAKLIELALVEFATKHPGAVCSAVGITNQRETTVAWDARSGKPLTNAIVWSDSRTAAVVEELRQQNGGSIDFPRDRTGLPLSTYFSACKMYWMLKHVRAVQQALADKTLRFGTIDSWLLWNLTKGKVHLTDCTNASRTLLMNLRSLDWDDALLTAFGVPRWALPKIVSCSEVMGKVTCSKVPGLRGVPISGCVGDQQGALVGQFCWKEGQAKNTYGTGCFLLANVGTDIRPSTHGLLSTVGFKFGNQPACYALEGSVAGAGSCIQWLRDKLNVIATATDSEVLATSVTSSDGVVFVPAFSGLLAPYWDPSARGVITGISQQTTKAHLVRAALESVAHQVTTLIRCMEKDAGANISSLAVDGGMVANRFVMQRQADYAQIEVRVPAMLETTALGAALCAGHGAGCWDLDRMRAEAQANSVTLIRPARSSDEVALERRQWEAAVDRCRGWAKI